MQVLGLGLQDLGPLAALDSFFILGPEVQKAANITVYVEFTTGTTVGTVVVEGAHRANFTGIWANLATIAWAAANRVHAFNVNGNHGAIRVRASVAVAGGSGARVYALVTG